MINNSLKTIILAAGESKRILSSKSKILHTIGGKTILGHVLDNIGKIISKKNMKKIKKVLNLGVSSYGTIREIKRLKLNKYYDQVDTIIIQYHLNDIFENKHFVTQ